MVRGPLKLADPCYRSFSRKVDTNIKHSFYVVFYIKLSLKMYSFLNIKCTLIISHYLTKTFIVSMTISTPLSNIVFWFILFCFVCFVFVLFFVYFELWKMIKCISIIESVNIVYYFKVLGTNVLKEYADLNSLYK